MISLSSIVKSGSFYVYSDDNESGAGWIQENRRSANQLDNSRELIMEQALRKSKHIYDEAVKRANEIIESAKDECNSISEQAEMRGYEEGYAKGFMEGIEEARKTSEEGIKEIEELILSLKRERVEAIERQKQDLLNIAFEIAKKIMKKHIQVDENAITNMLDDILHEDETGVKIYISEYSKTLNVKMDKDIAKKLKKTLKNAKVTVTQNDDLLMVETQNGMVDMSIPVQLKQLREAISLNL